MLWAVNGDDNILFICALNAREVTGTPPNASGNNITCIVEVESCFMQRRPFIAPFKACDRSATWRVANAYWIVCFKDFYGIGHAQCGCFCSWELEQHYLRSSGRILTSTTNNTISGRRCSEIPYRNYILITLCKFTSAFTWFLSISKLNFFTNKKGFYSKVRCSSIDCNFFSGSRFNFIMFRPFA